MKFLFLASKPVRILHAVPHFVPGVLLPAACLSSTFSHASTYPTSSPVRMSPIRISSHCGLYSQTGELSDAQKRFDSAEEEFIAAKLELKMCEEFKTELTEYLTMLIQENQKKKSAKLEELSATLRAGGQLTEVCRGCSPHSHEQCCSRPGNAH